MTVRAILNCAGDLVTNWISNTLVPGSFRIHDMNRTKWTHSHQLGFSRRATGVFSRVFHAEFLKKIKKKWIIKFWQGNPYYIPIAEKSHISTDFSPAIICQPFCIYFTAILKLFHYTFYLTLVRFTQSPFFLVPGSFSFDLLPIVLRANCVHSSER